MKLQALGKRFISPYGLTRPRTAIFKPRPSFAPASAANACLFMERFQHVRVSGPDFIGAGSHVRFNLKLHGHIHRLIC